MTGLFQVCVRFSIETESLYTAVERIDDYIENCPHEVDPKKKLKAPPKSWPNKGSIKLEYFVRNRNKVLKEISLQTFSCFEKVAMLNSFFFIQILC